MPWNMEETAQVQEQIKFAGGKSRIDKEHQRGKLLARERMECLFDNGEFSEIESCVRSKINFGDIKKTHFWGDGVIAGYGTVFGRTVFAAAQDSTISGGAGGEAHIYKICRTLELALEAGCPFVLLCDSGGARIEEGILSLAAYSRLFYLNEKASGVIPQIAAIMGNCAGGSSYSPAMCDFVFMVKNNAQFFITGPKVIRAMTGENVTMEELGGVNTHSMYSGQVHFVSENDRQCIEDIKRLLCFLSCPYEKNKDNRNKPMKRYIEDIVPENTRHSYNVLDVIHLLTDESTFMELSPDFASNMVVGFARMDGRSVGVVANQPNVLGGAIDCNAADKCARFVRTCDCFHIPLLVLVDVPGFLPGSAEEKKGILRHGCKILYSFAEATVPKITLIMRKAYGGAYCAMNSKELGADIVFAWPICEIAVMGADGAVDVIYHKQINEAENPDIYRQQKIAEYEKVYLTPYFAASCGMIDEIISPKETKYKIVKAFESLQNKSADRPKRKHGNIAL